MAHRGHVYTLTALRSRKVFEVWPGLLVTSVGSEVWYLCPPFEHVQIVPMISVCGMTFTTAMGLVFGYIFRRTESIVAPWLAHVLAGLALVLSGAMTLVQYLGLETSLRRRTAMLSSGFGAILLGLPYVLHAFGPTEAQVVIWGEVSLCTGVVLVFSAMGLGRRKERLAKVTLAFDHIILALLQVPPAVIWFAFHGRGTSDGTPPSAFVAHWGYSVPRLVLLGASLMVVYDAVQAAPPVKVSAHRQSDQ